MNKLLQTICIFNVFLVQVASAHGDIFFTVLMLDGFSQGDVVTYLRCAG